MTNELINKLCQAFGEPVADEKDVIFILSKIRKLIENENLSNNFPLLKRHTDWALHAKIIEASPMKIILQNIEKTILANKYQPSLVLEMVDFVEFRKQLISLLTQFNIPNKLNETDYWREFRKYFVEILVDCPLKPNFGEITEFCFKRGNGYEINFEIRFKTAVPISGSFNFLNH